MLGNQRLRVDRAAMDSTTVRILHMASGDLWAGAEAMMHALVQAQSRLPGVQVATIILNEGELAKRLRDSRVSTSVLHESQYGLLRLCREARRVMGQFRPHIVHTHRIKEDLVGALAALAHGPVRLVRTVHGVDEAKYARATVRHHVSRLVHRACVKSRFDLTFAVSRPLAAELSESLGDNRVTYVANGYDISQARGRRVRERQAEESVVLGIVGRLVPVKRVDLFLHAAALLELAAPGRFQFRIVGDGPERATLERQVQDLGLTQRVTFLGFRNDVLSEMQQMDALFITSDSEGLPMVVLEAMALRLPIVSHAVGEIPEVLDRGRCGTLIDVHEPQQYAAAAMRMLEDPSHVARAAEAGAARVVDRYSADACARSYLHHYHRLLSPAIAAAHADS
jgi:glycosyltransferase involved in cell wall biosynthesis